jgi:hypothetical protein
MIQKSSHHAILATHISMRISKLHQHQYAKEFSKGHYLAKRLQFVGIFDSLAGGFVQTSQL